MIVDWKRQRLVCFRKSSKASVANPRHPQIILIARSRLTRLKPTWPQERATQNSSTPTTRCKTQSATQRVYFYAMHTQHSRRANNVGILPDGVVDMTQGIVQVRGTGPPHVDHPIFSPSENKMMREYKIRIFQGKIYAPEGIKMYLKRFWEKKLADGKPCQPPTPPATYGDDSDSTPPKHNQEKPAVAQKKPAIQKPTGNGAKPSAKHISLKNWPKWIAAVVFTSSPPNATEAERDQWLLLWHCHHSTRMTQEGIVQRLTPHRATPQWVQTWADNAHAHFARQAATNASSNNPGTTTPEDNNNNNSLTYTLLS